MAILNHNRWFRYRYTLRSLSSQGCIMAEYDPNQFVPRTEFDQGKHEWRDLNLPTRMVNRRPEVEQAIEERSRRGYSLEDVAIKPHALPAGADPSKFSS